MASSTEEFEASAGDSDEAWYPLGAPPQELQLAFCLPTGQSFRWRKTGDNEYTGVIGERLVRLRQLPHDVHYWVLARGRDAAPGDDAAALRDYFHLGLDTRLSQLAEEWAAACTRFRDVSPHFPGARMLRQDPLECLFQFICSSNNHISRIHGMVERLCSSYGTPLEPEPGAGTVLPSPQRSDTVAAALRPDKEAAAGMGGMPPNARKRGGGTAGGATEAGAPAAGGGTGGGLSYYAFPTLEQLSRATEEELRAAGFGYRARFIVGTTRALRAKPGGGREWLLGLRSVGLQEAVGALTELPGIGPKVAACVCLFSLDKHAAIPVDTHVWQLALRLYCPQLRGRSLTKALHAEVQRAFTERFGPFAGWAHNTLFISELAGQQYRLPEHLRTGKGAAAAAARKAGGKRRGRSQGRAEGEVDIADDDGSGAEGDAVAAAQEEEGRDGAEAGAAARRRPRGAASKVTAGAAPPASSTGRGAVHAVGRRQQRQSRKAAALNAAAAVTAGVRVTRSDSSQEEGVKGLVAAPVCTAVVDGQADVGSPPARGGRRRGGSSAGWAQGPEPEPEHAKGQGRGRGKKRAAGGAGGAQPAQTSPGYELGDFDELAV